MQSAEIARRFLAYFFEAEIGITCIAGIFQDKSLAAIAHDDPLSRSDSDLVHGLEAPADVKIDRLQGPQRPQLR